MYYSNKKCIIPHPMTMKFPAVKYIYDRYKKASSSKKAMVEMRITYDRKQKYISTNISLFPDQWKNDKVVNCKDALCINAVLDKMMSEVKDVIYKMMQDGNVDIFQIPSKLQLGRSENITFTEWCEQRAAIRKYGKEKDTQERYDRFLKSFKKWGKIKAFDDVTEANIILYDRHLANQGMKEISKWHNYQRFLNSFILDAISEGLLKRNPYNWVNIDKGQESSGLDKCLTPKEFYRLRDAEMPTESLEKVRDTFVFQTYTCMSYSDLKSFNYTKIQEVNGMKVYTGSRKKTGKNFTIPLIQNALTILYKYNGKLPLISNVKYNAYLKVIAQAAGINKPLSTHWARHTGATMLLNEGVDMKIVSKICGHASTRITEQVYAKLLDETVVDAIMPFNP